MSPFDYDLQYDTWWWTSIHCGHARNFDIATTGLHSALTERRKTFRFVTLKILRASKGWFPCWECRFWICFVALFEAIDGILYKTWYSTTTGDKIHRERLWRKKTTTKCLRALYLLFYRRRRFLCRRSGWSYTGRGHSSRFSQEERNEDWRKKKNGSKGGASKKPRIRTFGFLVADSLALMLPSSVRRKVAIWFPLRRSIPSKARLSLPMMGLQTWVAIPDGMPPDTKKEFSIVVFRRTIKQSQALLLLLASLFPYRSLSIFVTLWVHVDI